MSKDRPVRLGIAGIGGYAGAVRKRVLDWGGETHPPVRLAAVCDPQLDRFGEVVTDLRKLGVAVHDDYVAMLDEDIDAVWLPLPIQLHLPFTRQALAAGKAVMCEKPAAGTVDEVDAMIAARDAAKRPVLIGFQDVYAPEIAPLKQRILAGEFGAITDATVWACWSRGSTYFGRSAWAGRLRVGDAWVLDSPANNAMAHFINVALFLLGPEPDRSATPERVYAELYRAADIESYDTCSLRIGLAGGATLTVNYTHACLPPQTGPVVTLHGEKATIVRDPKQLRIEPASGDAEVTPLSGEAMHRAVVQKFAQVVRGIDDPSIACASLEVARQHTLVINGAAEASPIVPLNSDVVQAVDHGNAGTVREVPGLSDAIPQITAARQTLHASGRFPFTTEGGTCDLRGYDHFAGPRQQLTS